MRYPLLIIYYVQVLVVNIFLVIWNYQPVKEEFLLFPFYWWGNRILERLSSLPRIMYLWAESGELNMSLIASKVGMHSHPKQ